VPYDDKKNPISSSRKAWGFVLGGMFVVAIVNVIIGVMSFPFDAQKRERERVERAEHTDAAVIRHIVDAGVTDEPDFRPPPAE
jgi:hypothetical protein